MNNNKADLCPRLFVLKNGDVCAEMRSLLSGHEPSYSYISEIYQLRENVDLYVIGHSTSDDQYVIDNVRCKTIRRQPGIWSELKFQVKLFLNLWRINPDMVVVVHPWEMLVIPFLWCQIRSKSFIPCLAKVPDVKNVSLFRRLLTRLAVKPILRSSKVILVRSSAIKEQLISWGIDEKHISIYLPQYTLDFFQGEYRLPVNTDDFNIVFIGRIVELKGVFDLIEIFHNVRLNVSRAKLFIAGDGPELAELKQQSALKGLDESIVFVGELSQTDVYGFFALADIAVLPSHQEGLGKTALEALLSGIPVIATSGTGFSQFVEHGVNGYLINPGAIEEFSNVIIDIACNEEMLSQLRKNAALTRDEILTNKKTFANYTLESIKKIRITKRLDNEDSVC